jgi:hypothetical protein
MLPVSLKGYSGFLATPANDEHPSPDSTFVFHGYHYSRRPSHPAFSDQKIAYFARLRYLHIIEIRPFKNIIHGCIMLTMNQHEEA